MTLDEMRAAALARVKQDNPSCTDFTTEKTYENIMDGTVFAIAFKETGWNEGYQSRLFSGEGGASAPLAQRRHRRRGSVS